MIRLAASRDACGANAREAAAPLLRLLRPSSINQSQSPHMRTEAGALFWQDCPCQEEWKRRLGMR